MKGETLNKDMKTLIIGGTGYIGSRLYKEMICDYEVDTVDLEWFGNNVNSNNYKMDFRELTENFLSCYDVVILLAGHSSVGMCQKDMISSFNNNVLNFIHILEKLRKISKLKPLKFIYASSSSVYGNKHMHISSETEEEFTPHNYYDLTKHVIDQYAKLSESLEYYGLRFGTVNGASPTIRNDIMINAMFESAKNNNSVKYSNPQNYRPILDISDLVNAVKTIIKCGKYEKRGLYNIISFNESVFNIAKRVSDILKVDITENVSNNIYSFSASNEKFSKVFDFCFKGSIESIVGDIDKSEDAYKYSNNRLIPFKYD